MCVGRCGSDNGYERGRETKLREEGKGRTRTKHEGEIICLTEPEVVTLKREGEGR